MWLLLLSHFSRVQFCATPSLGFSRQEHWSGLPFPSPVHKSEKWKWSRSVMSDSSRPHGLQPTRLLCPRDFPGKSTGVGCHCLLCHMWLVSTIKADWLDATKLSGWYAIQFCSWARLQMTPLRWSVSWVRKPQKSSVIFFPWPIPSGPPRVSPWIYLQWYENVCMH